MDSGDRPDNRLKATESSFGGFRSQSVSNLFHGFFGVKPAGTTSVTDIPSAATESKSTDGRSLDTIASPQDDDGWTLSHFLRHRLEKEGDTNIRRNVTWSTLEKVEHRQSPDGRSIALSITDIAGGKGEQDQFSTPLIQVEGDSAANVQSQSDAETRSQFWFGGEEYSTQKVVVPGNTEQTKHHQRNYFSSFLSHDIPHREVDIKPEEGGAQVERAGQKMNLQSQVTGSSLVGSDSVDRADSGLLPTAAITADKKSQSGHSLRDLLWSFNHEKITVSRKEMNLMASIDQ